MVSQCGLSLVVRLRTRLVEECYLVGHTRQQAARMHACGDRRVVVFSLLLLLLLLLLFGLWDLFRAWFSWNGECGSLLRRDAGFCVGVGGDFRLFVADSFSLIFESCLG